MKKILGLMIVGLLALAPIAAADTVTLDFTVANNTSALGTFSPYGSVTLTLNGGTIHFDVEMLNGFGLMQDAFGFNSPVAGLLGTNFSSSAYSAWDTTGNGQMDGFGTFDYRVSGPNPGSGLMVSSLQFDVSNPSGDFLSVFDLVNANKDGHPFAAHVYNPEGPVDARTGFVTTGTPTTVPEPASMLLLGSGLLGAGFFRRRQKKS